MNNLAAQTKVEKNPSRIDNDIQRVRDLTSRIVTSTSRIISHARTLGYFDPPPEGAGLGQATPIKMSLRDALDDLERAVDGNSGALNVFD